MITRPFALGHNKIDWKLEIKFHLICRFTSIRVTGGLVLAQQRTRDSQIVVSRGTPFNGVVAHLDCHRGIWTETQEEEEGWGHVESTSKALTDCFAFCPRMQHTR